MAPKVDDIIQSTSADDILDSYSGSSSLDNYLDDDFDLSNYGLDDYDSSNYDNYFDDDDLDSFDDYLDDDFGLDDSGPDDSDDGKITGDSGDSGSDDLLSGGPGEFDSDSSSYTNLANTGLADVWYYAAAGIHGVGLLAFIILLAVTLFAGLRKKNGQRDKTKPVLTIAISLVFFILWSIFSIIDKVATTGIGLSSDAMTAMRALSFICFAVTQVLLFCAFYIFLNDRFNRLGNSSGFHKIVKLVHWGFLGLLTVLWFVRTIINIVVEVKAGNFEIDPKLQDSAPKLTGAVDIISWLLSLEILACSVLALIQTRSSRGGSIASPITLVIAAFSFFIAWLTIFIISVRRNLVVVAPARYLIIVETIFLIAPAIVMYIAFIVLFAKSDRWEVPQDQAGQPQEPMQYQQPMGENGYKQPEYQYAPVPGPSPVSYQQPTPPPQPQQAPGTPPPQTKYQQPQAQYTQLQAPPGTPPPQPQYQQPQPQYGQPEGQYTQVPVPAPYPSQSPHP